jgi:hypothetical protein
MLLFNVSVSVAAVTPLPTVGSIGRLRVNTGTSSALSAFLRPVRDLRTSHNRPANERSYMCLTCLRSTNKPLQVSMPCMTRPFRFPFLPHQYFNINLQPFSTYHMEGDETVLPADESVGIVAAKVGLPALIGRNRLIRLRRAGPTPARVIGIARCPYS